MKPPRFSVIVIVLNGENFLAEALESIRRQTTEDWEAIIVDDGSSDHSLDIAFEFQAGQPERIRVLRHQGGSNRGMSASRNLGFEHARGAFIVNLDHDDTLEPGKLECLHRALERHPAAMAAIGPNLRWHDWKADSTTPNSVQDLMVPTDELLEPPGFLPTFLQHSDSTPLGPMIRAEAMRELGGYDSAFTGMHEDQAFFSRLMLNFPIVVIDDVLHRYRLHQDSCVAITHQRGRDLQARRFFLKWLEQTLDAQPEKHPEIKTILAAEMRRTRGWKMRMLKRTLINLRGDRDESHG